MAIKDCFTRDVLNPRVIHHESLGSTSIEAKDLLSRGETEGAVVVADTQTAGRGRKGRSWISPKGGLYFSIILQPRLGDHCAPLLGILSACAVRRALHTFGVKAQVKWPNDILVGEKKIAGILSEAVTVGDGIVGVVIGIGVNQNCPVSAMSSGLEWSTTSILDEIGKETSKTELLCEIVNEIDSLLRIVETNSSFSAILEEWRKMSSTLGKLVHVYEDETVTKGVATDIDEDGALFVETEDGLIRVFLGDVHHLKNAE